VRAEYEQGIALCCQVLTLAGSGVCCGRQLLHSMAVCGGGCGWHSATDLCLIMGMSAAQAAAMLITNAYFLGPDMLLHASSTQ
jgi:hypothetical protein